MTFFINIDNMPEVISFETPKPMINTNYMATQKLCEIVLQNRHSMPPD